MKNAAQCAKKLNTLLRKLPAAEAPGFPDAGDPIAVLIQSFLLADATTEKAMAAYRRLCSHVVDFNDLRVSMPAETLTYIGSRYPRGLERCRRLRSALRNVYLREHAVSLECLEGLGKRDIRKYIESLSGMSPYVSARVLLLCFQTHAVPVDEQLRLALAAAGVVDAEADEAAVASWLARRVKAVHGFATHLAFQRWMDQRAAPGRSRRRTVPAGGGGKTSGGGKPPQAKRAAGRSAPRIAMGPRAAGLGAA